MTNIRRGEISNFILSNRDFLELAFDVEDAMLGGPSKPRDNTGEGVRSLLVNSVLQSLKDHILSQLDHAWEIEISPLLSKWGSMGLRKRGWPRLRDTANGPPIPVEIRLANDIGNWQQVCIGFRAHRFGFPDPSRANLTAALLPVMMPGAVANDWWVAVEWPSNPFRDWWDKRFLIDIGYSAYLARVHDSAPQPREIKELGDHLVGIARAAEKAVPVEWSVEPINS